jgi:hypothetical protein
MRFSFRTSAIAAVAALALAACGGHAMVPSQNFSQNPIAGGAFAVPDAGTPCSTIKGFWQFGGACKAYSLTAAGATYKLPYYKGIALHVTVGKNSATKSIPFLLGDATGKGDITGTYKTKKFPPYSTKTCAKSPCAGTPMLYFEAFNQTKTSVKVTGDSGLLVLSKTFPGKSCFPALLGTKGWTPYTIVQASVKNGKVAIKIPGFAGVFNLPAGPAYGVLVCH